MVSSVLLPLSRNNSVLESLHCCLKLLLLLHASLVISLAFKLRALLA